MFRLDVFLEDEAVASIALEERVTVGRGESNDLRLPDPAVSRRHGTFLLDRSSGEPRIVLRDEGSTNGTAVNGQVIRRAETVVGPGDEIHIGPFRFSIKVEGESGRDGSNCAGTGTAVLSSAFAPWRSIPVERLSALFELARAELPADLDGLAEVLATVLAPILPYSVMAISLDREGQPPAEVVWTPGGRRDPRERLIDPEVIHLCRSSRRTVAVPERSRFAPWVLESDEGYEGQASIICLPLQSPAGEQLGALYFAAAHGSPYRSADLEFALLVANAVAASLGRRRVEEALRRAKEAAEASDRAKSRFLANMSHELRTPLHAVLSYARFGLGKIDTAPKEKLLEYFRRIEESGNELLALLNQLLDLASLETQELKYELARTDLAAIVEAEIAERAAEFEARGMQVRFSRPPFSAELEADAERIAQVVKHLLANALKFGGRDSRVDIGIEETAVETNAGPAPGLLLTVMDEGMGIPEDELERIFEKFSESSRTASGAGGRGLGLATCRGIAAAHGGWISAANRSDRSGAVFQVALPRKPPETAPCRRGEVPGRDTSEVPELAPRSAS